MIEYDGYTKEEIKRLIQNNQNLGQAQERMEQLRSELFAVGMQHLSEGTWIEDKGYDKRDHFYTCSECGRSINIICGESLADYPYCHCGADMRGEQK